MAILTPNFNLIKPDPTDFYNVADQNTNMDKLDVVLLGKASSIHAAQHGPGGSDPITTQEIGAAPAVHTHDAEAITSGVLDVARVPLIDVATGLLGTGEFVRVATGTYTGTGNYNPMSITTGFAPKLLFIGPSAAPGLWHISGSATYSNMCLLVVKGSGGAAVLGDLTNYAKFTWGGTGVTWTKVGSLANENANRIMMNYLGLGYAWLALG